MSAVLGITATEARSPITAPLPEAAACPVELVQQEAEESAEAVGSEEREGLFLERGDAGHA